MTDRLAIGRIGRPHGVHGAMRVHSYSDETEHFRGLERILLRRDGDEREVAVDTIQIHGRSPVLRLAGVATPEAARSFTGYEILVPREVAAPLGADEFYVADLVGLELCVEGRSVGRICGVIEAPQAPLLELEPNAAGRTVLIPFLRRFVGEPDLVSGSIELKAPWLLDSE